MPRDVNQLAHNLANAALSLTDVSIFLCGVPACIQDIVYSYTY